MSFNIRTKGCYCSLFVSNIILIYLFFLQILSGDSFYILTDKATYLSHDMKDNFKILIEEAEELKTIKEEIREMIDQIEVK